VLLFQKSTRTLLSSTSKIISLWGRAIRFWRFRHQSDYDSRSISNQKTKATLQQRS